MATLMVTMSRRLSVEQRVTHFVSTPSLALVQFQGKYAKECTALRFVMFGGEQLPREVINMFDDKVSWCCIIMVCFI